MSVQRSIQWPLGPYAVNVTTAAKLCSQSLCSNHGRCVRKTPESSFYLHMPESSSKKHISNKSFSFVLSEKNKQKTIMDMKEGFMCHCYYGWHGESCLDSSDLLSWKNKAPTANFNLPVFLGLIISAIPLNIFYSLLQCHFLFD